jgi:2'-5' RNA ligase
MGCSENGHERVNQFALVSYIPGALGVFLDELRLELVPECRPHAHVTILPPRPVSGDPNLAIQELRSRIGDFEAFDVRLGEIEKFPVSDVIYLGVRDGERQLRAMYEALNRGALAFEEPFPYHPHITLAQNIEREDVDRLFALACRRWREYMGSRSFRVDTLTFVQNTSRNQWLDLAKIPLAVPVG